MALTPYPVVSIPNPDLSFLEHLHKHQGSVLHPDYKTAFPSFEDALHRLLPYHVYQGALPSPNDYHKGEAFPQPLPWPRGYPSPRPALVGHLTAGRSPRTVLSARAPHISGPARLLFLTVDEEFETVSTQLLKRTQAMLNKYRLLLLEESRVGPSTLPVWTGREGGRRSDHKDSLESSVQIVNLLLTFLFSLPPQRVSPSAEMVMIDRMFIQEEKTTLALDRQLAKEKPGERGGEERGFHRSSA